MEKAFKRLKETILNKNIESNVIVQELGGTLYVQYNETPIFRHKGSIVTEHQAMYSRWSNPEMISEIVKLYANSVGAEYRFGGDYKTARRGYILPRATVYGWYAFPEVHGLRELNLPDQLEESDDEQAASEVWSSTEFNPVGVRSFRVSGSQVEFNNYVSATEVWGRDDPF